MQRIVIFSVCLSALIVVGALATSMLQAADAHGVGAINSYVLQNDNMTLARYRFDDVPFKPYVDELRTPSGKNILRDAPADHVHHHALMYAICVGGCNFWEEADQTFGKQVTVKHQSTGDSVESVLHWNTSEQKTLLEETRKIHVGLRNDATLLDWQSTLKAVDDTVLGGDERRHYHGLGLRFVDEMDKGGRFFNDAGNNNGENVRGSEQMMPCRWMAYTAKLEGKPVTVALFDYPSNPVPMTAFTMGGVGSPFAYLSATMNLHHKPVKLEAGQSFAVKYRIAVWDGEVSPETVEAQYREFVR